MKIYRTKRNKLFALAIALGILLVGADVETRYADVETRHVASLLQNFVSLPAQANEAAQPKMQLRLTVERQVPIEEAVGESAFEWQPLSQLVPVLPGEIIRYQLVGRNNGSESVSALVLTQPIPPEMVYIINSAAGASNITFSVDNGETFSANPTVNTVNENGQLVREPAPPENYTHVRWEFERILAPGQELVGTFQVKVR